jgi:hypothetical protein
MGYGHCRDSEPGDWEGGGGGGGPQGTACHAEK